MQNKKSGYAVMDPRFSNPVSLTVGGCVTMRIDYFSDTMFLILFTEEKNPALSDHW